LAVESGADEVAVSVVVPVHNPGEFIGPCVDSLLAQTLSAEAFEAIFVDDGSTDGTAQRLDGLAAAHAHLRVIHEPASGWSGRPRNAGMDVSAGRYVFFCDHDDWLSPEALERMIDYAERTGADVLVPKMVGHGRSVPRQLFAANDPDASVSEGLLTTSLTPHKLFRRDFLHRHGLRFPEGPRRLEDHVFVMAAYLHASRIAVLADYPCYHHIGRPDASNAGYEAPDPHEYFGYLREVLDVVDALTEPGPLRDVVRERSFSNEMLGRVTRRRAFADQDADYRRRIFAEVRDLMRERFPPEFGERLAAVPRVRAELVRDDRYEDLLELNDRSTPVTMDAALSSLRWDVDRWRAQIETRVTVDGAPLRLLPAGGDRWVVDPRLLPEHLAGGRTVTDEEVGVGGLLTVVERGGGEEWFVPAAMTTELSPIGGDPDSARTPVVRVSAELDATALAGGRPLSDGLWDISMWLPILGVGLQSRVAADHSTQRPLPTTAVVGPRPATVTPYLTDDRHRLAIDVGQRKHTLVSAICRGPSRTAVVDGSQLRVAIAVDVAPGAGERRLRVALRTPDRVVGHLEAVIIADADGPALQAPTMSVAADDDPIEAGRYQLAAKSRAKDPLVTIGFAQVDVAGRIVAAVVGATASPASDP
jgi:poly(ribitol-phosphate) beta-N-acetylglucosaminyltransferase